MEQSPTSSTRDSKDQSARIARIRILLSQLTTSNGNIFDCSKETLRSGYFDQVSHGDLKPSNHHSDQRVQFLLTAKARLKLRIKIAQQMLKRLKGLVNQQSNIQ